MKLIVGLGNPGKEYDDTRHNMGFYYIDQYASRKGIVIDKEKFNGLFGEFYLLQEKIILLKPQNYINLSGEVIKKYIDYYKISLQDTLIICDDLDTEMGKYRLRAKGSSGGHNGLKNIELMLNTCDYFRLKIGISNNKLMDTKDYVLSKLDYDSKQKRDNNIDVVCNIIDDFCQVDFSKLMSKYNKK